MRVFDTGATRDDDTNKFDYGGFLSPQVLRRYAEYMHRHRTQADGQMRPSDNWKKGIPRDAYMKSMCRHFVDVWDMHEQIAYKHGGEDYSFRPEMPEALCALLFNVMGYLYELENGR